MGGGGGGRGGGLGLSAAPPPPKKKESNCASLLYQHAITGRPYCHEKRENVSIKQGGTGE